MIHDYVTIGLTIAALIFGAKYLAFKKRLRAFRQFIDELDGALEDDSVSDEEYRRLWGRFKDFLDAKK